METFTFDFVIFPLTYMQDKPKGELSHFLNRQGGWTITAGTKMGGSQ